MKQPSRLPLLDIGAEPYIDARNFVLNFALEKRLETRKSFSLARKRGRERERERERERNQGRHFYHVTGCLYIPQNTSSHV